MADTSEPRMTAPDQNPALALLEQAIADGPAESGCTEDVDDDGNLLPVYATVDCADLRWLLDERVALIVDNARLLDSLNQAEAGVPEGWVLVPREPTEAMLFKGNRAAREPHKGYNAFRYPPVSLTREAWFAMVDVAPTATTGSAPDAS